MSTRRKIVIDTDCGVDDALALLVALGDDCEIVAITCCFGNVSLDKVCNNVKRVLTFCGRKIPIYRGSGSQLCFGDTKYSIIHGSDGFGDVSENYPTGDLKEEDAPAAVALLQLSHQHQGLLTLVALGPLTNLALAHRLDPNFTSRLESVVCMGGGYKGLGNITEVAEFNIYCDPEAASVVFNECLCPLTLVPLEATHAGGIPWDVYERLAATTTKKGEFFRRITAKSSARRRTFSDVDHDPDLQAMCAALHPECVRTSIQGAIYVECGDGFSRGMLVLRRQGGLPITIVTAFHNDVLEQLRFRSLAD